MEILPAIDLRGGKCVRLRQGDYSQETVYDDDPAGVARRFQDAGAGRLHLVDLDGARQGRPVNEASVRTIVEAVQIPCQLGGGVRDEPTIQRMLEQTGVERVIIGTQALREPEWFRDMVHAFPGRIALGLDARDSLVAVAGWEDVSAQPAIDLARQYRDLPLAAVIYTNIANDGMLQGVDAATIADLVRLSELGLSVIASGGVTTLDDVRRLADTSRVHPGIVGAIIGRAVYEGTIDVAEAVRVAKHV